MGDNVGTNLVGDAVGMAGTMGAGLTIGDSVNVMGAKGVNVMVGESAALGVGAADDVCATTMSTGDMFDIAKKNTRITHFDTIASLHCRYRWIMMLPFCHDIKIM